MANEPELDVELARVRQERDLYQHLLELGTQDEIEPFLQKALDLMVQLAGARRGYIELQDERERKGDATRFSIAHGCSDAETAAIREAFSQGVIAEALATGKTIATVALEDPRFRDLLSVRLNQIQAVLCAPIGTTPCFGVLYLQDRVERGPFTSEDRRRAETVARHIAPFVDRLLLRRRRRDETDPTLPFRKNLRLRGVIGRSAALAKVLQQVTLVAPLEVGVLLTGPSGTGKTQLARIIHDNGPRAAGPFVELNCATLPETILENELFGSLPGAHSTATRRTEGKVAAAQGGTLFLDEIGELALGSQSKLLQLLQSKEYYLLGSNRPERADVRVIAATNTDLKAAVARRAFREDLLYRLEVLPIRVPSLGERPEDIAELATYFCERSCESHHLPRLRLSVGAICICEASEWPGNIRQLAHAIEAATIRAAGEGVLQIERKHLVDDLQQTPPNTFPTFQEITRRCQEQFLRRTLEETNWNITTTATRLDLARSHIYNLIKAFGIERQGHKS